MGLNRLHVELENYNENWKKKFEDEKQVLKQIFKDDAIQIEHVGSTSIPGLKAKPIIDIALAVKELDITLKYIEKMEEEGYSFRGNAGVEGRYFFAKGPEENRTHYVHVEPINSPNWESHLLYKRYLLENPEAVLEYEKLKEELAELYPHDRKKYTSGKNDFIQEILKKAREKYKND